VSAAFVIQAIVGMLQLAGDLAEKIGDVVTAKKVNEILGDRFPEFFTRAEKAGEDARAALDDRARPSNE
jgi:hypothetical protein